MNEIRQGDVLFVAMDLPRGTALRSVAPKNGRYVLAEGEATGHAHILEATPEIELREDATGILWLTVVEGEATITHQEHAPVTLPPGTYALPRQMEYAEVEGLKRVAD